MIQEKTLKGFQVKSLFEYFNGLISKPGERPSFSCFVWNNYNLLQPAYYEVQRRIAQRDPDVIAYEEGIHALYVKYAERDEQGEIKTHENGQPIIADKADELNAEVAKLAESYDNINEKLEADHYRENNAMNADFTVNLDCITFSEYVDTCPPFVVGLTHI